MSRDTHTELSLTLFKHSKVTGEAPLDILHMVNKELQETLTIRSLLHLCTACKKRPSAQMLAFAVQNSIPSLVGLPMDNPDPGFYIDIARGYFRPLAIDIEVRSDVYRACIYIENRSSEPNLDMRYHNFKNKWDCFRNEIFYASRNITGTQSGRKFLTELMLDYKTLFQRRKPGDARFTAFFDDIVSILNHGFVLRYRHMCPGLVGVPFGEYRNDEHL